MEKQKVKVAKWGICVLKNQTSYITVNMAEGSLVEKYSVTLSCVVYWNELLFESKVVLSWYLPFPLPSWILCGQCVHASQQIFNERVKKHSGRSSAGVWYPL